MTNPFEQRSLEQLRQRSSIKWRWYPPDVLPLWVAEMDAVLAEPIVEAVSAALVAGDTGYPVPEQYAQAMSVFAEKRWGWSLDGAVTSLVPDVMLGVVEVLKLVTEPGDGVVVCSPVYHPFYAFIEHLGRRVVEAPLGPDHRIDFETLSGAFAQRVDGRPVSAFLLCSPHNPTGTVHTADELRRIAELADEHGVRVVADEIHAPVVPRGATFVPYLTVPGSERGFAMLSASKAWNLSGAKSALAVAGDAASGDLARMPEEVTHGASHLGVIAHAVALQDCTEWLDDMLEALDANRSLLTDLLAEHIGAIRYRPPQGTYLAWLDCRELGLGDDPAEAFLQRGRVAFSSGPQFGTGGAGHVRLNLATSADVLTEAVRRMAASL